MRLENKLHKWFKFILKLLPLLVLLIPFFAIFTKNSVGTYDTFQDFVDAIMLSYASFSENSYVDDLFSIDIFTSFNTFFILNIFNIGGAWYGNSFTLTILVIFEYWLIIDFIDLIFSAFRFIIDICRSWLDSFYDKNKGGYK